MFRPAGITLAAFARPPCPEKILPTTVLTNQPQPVKKNELKI
jgi:hypothetical protein